MMHAMSHLRHYDDDADIIVLMMEDYFLHFQISMYRKIAASQVDYHFPGQFSSFSFDYFDFLRLREGHATLILRFRFSALLDDWLITFDWFRFSFRHWLWLIAFRCWCFSIISMLILSTFLSFRVDVITWGKYFTLMITLLLMPFHIFDWFFDARFFDISRDDAIFRIFFLRHFDWCR